MQYPSDCYCANRAPVESGNRDKDGATSASQRCFRQPDEADEGTMCTCPFCSGQQVSVTNSLEALHPDIAAQWHPTKNGDLTPADVTAGSNKEVWWICPEGPDHEWPASTVRRTQRGDACPFCAGRRVSATNSLEALYPEIAAEWHRTKNGDLTPDRFRPSRPYGSRSADPDMARRASRAFPRCRLGSGLQHVVCHVL